jgi:polysaccharide biosynthesis protein PelE
VTNLFFSGLVLLGVALQAGGIVLGVGPTGSVPTAIALVLAGALLGGWPMLLAVTPPKTRPRPADLVLIIGFGLFVPALGLLGLGLVLTMRARSGPRSRRSEVVETDAPVLPGSPLHTDESARFGPGSLEGILRGSKDPETRLRVVLACRQLPGRLAVPLLRLALRDTVDDVRLLAYAVLESKERNIQTQIQGLLSRADASAKAGTKLPVLAHVKLAELYWELVYQGLVEGELLGFSLEQVSIHTGEVLRASAGNPRMALVAGRALLLRGRGEEARAMLNDALRRGLPVEVVGPYLAEVEFLARKPDEVRRHVATFSASARLRQGLSIIVERWT